MSSVPLILILLILILHDWQCGLPCAKPLASSSTAFGKPLAAAVAAHQGANNIIVFAKKRPCHGADANTQPSSAAAPHSDLHPACLPSTVTNPL